MSGKRALITGLNGFTGRYVAAELQQAGYQVFGVDANDINSGLPCCQVDLADLKALQRTISEVDPHVVVHLAAVAFVGHGDANDFYRVNLMGTRNLLVALESAAPHVESVLLASSANIYGNAAAGRLSETTPPAPGNDYAVSKLAMEHMARLWQGRLPLFIVRPFNYTGVGQSPNFVVPKIVDHFLRGAEVIELGNLDVWREFNDVRFVAKTYRRLLESPPVGQTLNICTERMYSLRELIAAAQEITGHSVEVKVYPAFVRQNEIVELCGDNTRLKTVIGEWEEFDLQKTLSWMLLDGGSS